MNVSALATLDVRSLMAMAEITPEQLGRIIPLSFDALIDTVLAQMNSVREHVRAVIGAPKPSGISDKEIDDASWEFYFDLDQTMDHILGVYAISRLLTSDTAALRGPREAQCGERKTRYCTLLNVHLLPPSSRGLLLR